MTIAPKLDGIQPNVLECSLVVGLNLTIAKSVNSSYSTEISTKNAVAKNEISNNLTQESSGIDNGFTVAQQNNCHVS